jgi:hypothetical protein
LLWAVVNSLNSALHHVTLFAGLACVKAISTALEDITSVSVIPNGGVLPPRQQVDWVGLIHNSNANVVLLSIIEDVKGK